ncbi:hypothetical protein AVEN_198274-1, partial [Araneus ventricosus]
PRKQRTYFKIVSPSDELPVSSPRLPPGYPIFIPAVMFPPREHRSHGKESPVSFMSAANRRAAAPGGR